MIEEAEKICAELEAFGKRLDHLRDAFLNESEPLAEDMTYTLHKMWNDVFWHTYDFKYIVRELGGNV